MTMAKMTRDELKAACLDLLEKAATEHPAGHQGKLAARFILKSPGSQRVGLMFEKSEKTKPHLWLERRFAQHLMAKGIEYRDYPASDLYREMKPGGSRAYGRHAALQSMRDLANVDLVRFTIDRVDQLQTIVTHLATVS